MEEIKREKSIIELETELKEMAKKYKDLSDTIQKKKDAEEKKKVNKLEAEKNIRRKEIEDKYAELRLIIDSYIKDFGAITIYDMHTDREFPMLSKFFRYFDF